VRTNRKRVEQLIENQWSARHAVTIEDFEFLAACGISYGDPCGMESNAPPAWMSEPLNIYSNRGDEPSHEESEQ
jgi:hypothetical protein